ncbi:phosphotransferase enzyme family protein [Ilumatobacter nonamiensis]|uniref:phosphotransferase enzyme family protein n=1 Tax=Ilumatobacter nonamiensis TaxID=467093 RepID=UPI00130E4933|nr:phosphotransferase [Ilumatobacter nonamiensis]
MSRSSPLLPRREEMQRLGVDVDRELHAGKQSRVFAGTVNGHTAVVKLTEARLADRAALAERMAMTESLADLTEVVAAPIRIDDSLVSAVGDWWLTATPFVAGRQADIAVTADAWLLGRTLGELHAELGRLGEWHLPPVEALVDDRGDRSRWQLLHGDFSDQNVIVTPNGPRVFDFDDCGYGPVLYDVANSLYMVLFDAEVNADGSRYSAFRSPFLDGYADATRHAVDRVVIDSLIGSRIDALGRWLDDLERAPIGIRTSSPEWLNVLRAFVATHTSTPTRGPR